ncbi:MAG TPA: acyl-CoA dehydrogenase family protein [Verrucomicrobiae bacterium]|nr:acyl-CoA dehydrogenase family protein [Verrucomicrobiae bacterium]
MSQHNFERKHDSPVELYYRDAKSYQIVEGSSNVQKMIIAQDALGYRKANRQS